MEPCPHLMPFVPLALLLACLAALALRRLPASFRITSVLETRYAPAIVGVLWALLPFLVWRGGTPMPLDHDEAAYLLQAEIFAMGRWASPSPPVPELFGQAHVLVTPVLASKYPPGHSLLLALGVLAGAPAVIVFLLNAVRVGLVFALARRLTDATTALLSVLLLYLGNDQARFSSSYYSQTTSGAALVASWYFLWRWRDSRHRGWLLGVAAALGWCAITRPWSAVAFALPIGWVVLRDVWRGDWGVAGTRWRDVAAAMALGACIVAIIPLWGWGTLGDWRRLPQVEYMKDYMPFDFPHFGSVGTPPRRTPPPDVASINVSLLEAERRHTLANLPEDARLRLMSWWNNSFPSPTLMFVPLALVGLAVLPMAGYVAVATLVVAFSAYLAHPTWPQWTVYFLEVTPVLTLLAAIGVITVLRILGGEWRGRRLPDHAGMPRATLAGLACCVLMIPQVLAVAGRTRAGLTAATAERREFEAAVAGLRRQPAIVFVRYGRKHSPHRSLTVNRADWQHAAAWIVYEMGPLSLKLLELAPDRHPYIYDSDARVFMEVKR